MKRPTDRRMMMMAASTLVVAVAFLQGLARFIH
jgi:hypothetical protein